MWEIRIVGVYFSPDSPWVTGVPVVYEPPPDTPIVVTTGHDDEGDRRRVIGEILSSILYSFGSRR